MPNNIVFPGGLCEPADFSLSWFDSFAELKNFSVNPSASYPDIFVNDSTPKEEQWKVSNILLATSWMFCFSC